jgi:dienelactone hydrolase
MYTTYLQRFAGLNYRVGAAQQHELVITPLQNKAEIKRYREQEVIKRAVEYHKTIEAVKNEKIVLVGHSYGGATVIQAYHTL